jgi:hypothetical protein
MAAKRVKDPLVGKYFHSVKEDRKTIEWQGEITARVGDSYLLQLFEWVAGYESNQSLVPIADLNYWKFYDSAEEMNNHYHIYRLWKDREEASNPGDGQ